MTQKMLAPGAVAGQSVTVANTGNSYTSDVNGLINAAISDIGWLESAGYLPIPERPVVTLTLSTAGTVVLGAINILPSSAASTASYAYIIPAPTVTGIKTTITQPSGSTAASTFTSSGANINLTNTNATVLTFTGGGTVDFESVGSTLFQITNRTPTGTSSAASVTLTFQPASS